MCELTLQANGYRDDEAQVARRLHDLAHERPPELPAWLTRKGTWTSFVDIAERMEKEPCTSAK